MGIINLEYSGLISPAKLVILCMVNGLKLVFQSHSAILGQFSALPFQSSQGTWNLKRRFRMQMFIASCILPPGNKVPDLKYRRDPT